MDGAADGTRAMKRGVVEVLDRDGHARMAVPVWRWPVTLGRAVDCDVVLDDVHVAARHATIDEQADGVLTLEVGESLNGAQWTGTRLPAGGRAALPPGEVFQLGSTRLRIRRPSDALPPERALAPEPSAGRVPLPALLAALLAWTIGRQWLDSDPGGRLTDYIPIVLAFVLGLVVWCGLWALASKLFRHRFEFWPHTRIAASYLLAVEALGLLLPLLAFVLGWTLLSRLSGFAAGAVTSAMVVAHLARIVPTRRRMLAATMAVLFAVGAAIMIVRNYQAQDRVFTELYVTTLAPPALRLASPVEPSQFIDEARRLKAPLDAHAKDDEGDSDEAFWGDE